MTVAAGPPRRRPAVQHVQGDETKRRCRARLLGGRRGSERGAGERAHEQGLHTAVGSRSALLDGGQQTPAVVGAPFRPVRGGRGLGAARMLRASLPILARVGQRRDPRRPARSAPQGCRDSEMRHNKGSMDSPGRDLRDTLGRPLRNLRVSVTDRCNLRCQYCMPEEEYTWLRRADLLTFEEIQRLVEIFTELGVDKVRLTGGEPLLRRGLPDLIRMLVGIPALRDLAMTSNGVLLGEQSALLRAAGLHRITVSLDTLRPDRFRALTRRDDHAAVLRGIEAVRSAGFTGLKLDAVVMRGVNDDELVDLVEFARR